MTEVLVQGRGSRRQRGSRRLRHLSDRGRPGALSEQDRRHRLRALRRRARRRRHCRAREPDVRGRRDGRRRNRSLHPISAQGGAGPIAFEVIARTWFRRVTLCTSDAEVFQAIRYLECDPEIAGEPIEDLDHLGRALPLLLSDSAGRRDRARADVDARRDRDVARRADDSLPCRLSRPRR